MKKFNAIYVSILALIVAVAALVMCIMCCSGQKANPAVVSEEGVMAVLKNNPQMIVDALQLNLYQYDFDDKGNQFILAQTIWSSLLRKMKVAGHYQKATN